jgi:cytochrome c oxidase cbb3-type subunit 4
MEKTFKAVVASVENAGLYQTIAFVLFFLFFLAVLLIIWKKPKDYYKEDSELPLDED